MMLEAFHRSFPDEVGEPEDGYWDKITAPSNRIEKEYDGLSVKLETTEYAELKDAVAGLLDTAGEMEDTLKSTNRQESTLSLHKNASGWVNELVLIRQEGPRQQKFAVRYFRGGCSVERITTFNEQGKRQKQELIVRGVTSSLERNSGEMTGSAFDRGSRYPLDEPKTLLGAANSLLKDVSDELIARLNSASGT
ncbi:MAG TPA: hypothetical protein VMU97_01770 [Candidatus Dormibacteraeota bacterium]|nr:hypothetical protein [Candidatus Dormibacteraeota bacterium]